MSEHDVAQHVQHETNEWDVIITNHKPRGAATPLFHKTKQALIDREGGRCQMSGMSAEESGHPLEAHHWPVERCFAEAGMVDWALFAEQAKAGRYGPHAKAFDWASFDPEKWETFVDDMRYNGLLLAKQFHIGKDMGIHMMPHPIWIAQGFVKDGIQFNHLETIHRKHMPSDDEVL